MTSVTKVAAVGWRVRVFWEGDDEWFEGVVTQYTPENGYFVQYDDGEQQWEAEDPTSIEFLYNTDDTAQLIVVAEEAERIGDEETYLPSQEAKWSAQPPPSTTENGDDDTYEQDEYDDDHELNEEHEATTTAASPKPEEDETDQQQPIPGEEIKLTSRATPLTRTVRDPTKYVKSGVFFRDPETLRETKVVLQKEKHDLQTQYEVLTSQLDQKELLSQSLKRELHGLKAQVTVASLKGQSCASLGTMPKTVRDWTDRVVAQKMQNRAIRQALSELHMQLTQKQAMIQQMEKQKQQLDTKLTKVSRKELCSLVEIQMEIAQVAAEKRELETQLVKTLSVEHVKHDKNSATSVASSLAPRNERDAKTELEKELRTLEKTLLSVRDEVDDWKLSYEKETAKITPLHSRIERLQVDLRNYESSQVLLRSMFMRLDRTGTGLIALEAALDGMMMLASRDGTTITKQELQRRLPETTSTTLDFAAFVHCFREVFSQR